VRQRIRALGLEDRASCPGWLSREEAAQALASASIFVLPSYAEGLPMALLEAMSYALPVVTTPVGGIPGVIRHGENGLLVDPGDIQGITAALASLLQDPAERTRLGTATRRTIEQHFSQDVAIDQLARLYERFGVPTTPRPV
jgi:glycosyltransferase involved in cell wall biosynthesis